MEIESQSLARAASVFSSAEPSLQPHFVCPGQQASGILLPPPLQYWGNKVCIAASAFLFGCSAAEVSGVGEGILI